MEKVDITIIGAGIIGLAVSYALSSKGKSITVIEKNPSFGQEQSSRNSEVVHAGLYYPKNSLKTEMCIRGKDLLYDLCRKHDIPFKKLGKIIVASDSSDIAKIDGIFKNASECGVKNLKYLDKKDIKKLEPDVEAEKGLFSPDTGIVDSHKLMEFFLKTAKEKGVDFSFSVEVISVEKKKSFYKVIVKEPNGDTFSFESKIVINCAGLQSDKVAELVGIDPDKNNYRIHYCKGEYFRIKNPKKFNITHLVYPPPHETDLGIHLTPDLAGGLRLGPNAKYTDRISYEVDDTEKEEFFKSSSKFLPKIDINDIIPDTAGVRAKLQKKGEGFRDFVIKDEAEKGFPGFINLIGIESPGLTGSIAIAEKVLQWSNTQ